MSTVNQPATPSADAPEAQPAAACAHQHAPPIAEAAEEIIDHLRHQRFARAREELYVRNRGAPQRLVQLAVSIERRIGSEIWHREELHASWEMQVLHAVPHRQAEVVPPALRSVRERVERTIAAHRADTTFDPSFLAGWRRHLDAEGLLVRATDDGIRITDERSKAMPTFWLFQAVPDGQAAGQIRTQIEIEEHIAQESRRIAGRIAQAHQLWQIPPALTQFMHERTAPDAPGVRSLLGERHLPDMTSWPLTRAISLLVTLGVPADEILAAGGASGDARRKPM